MGSLVPSSPKRAWRLFQVLEVASKGTKDRIRREAKTVRSIWTSHQVPRFLIPEMKCESYNISTMWKPTDSKWPTIYSCKLSKLWKVVRDVPGLNITEYSRRQDIHCKKGLSIATGVVCFIEAQNYSDRKKSRRNRGTGRNGLLIYSINAIRRAVGLDYRWAHAKRYPSYL